MLVNILKGIKMTNVAAAIIVRNGKVFIAQRPAHKFPPLKWEFPGGKQETGESLQQTLHRELNEELKIDAKIGDFFMQTTHTYDKGTIEMSCYFASVPEQTVIISNEHAATAWVTPQEMNKYDFADADKPVVAALQKIKLNHI